MSKHTIFVAALSLAILLTIVFLPDDVQSSKLASIVFVAWGTFISLFFLILGITWCVSPKTHIRLYNTLIPAQPITRERESEIYSIEGRIAGLVFACAGGGFLYVMLFEIAWKHLVG